MRHTLHDGPAHPVRNLRIMAFAAAVASLLSAPAAPAAYVRLTQARSLATGASANLGGGTPTTDADSVTSTDLGSFDQSVFSSASASNPTPPPLSGSTGNGLAHQFVGFTATGITGSLTGDAWARSTLAESSAGATSTWSTTFRVDQPTPFDLDARLGVSNVTNSLGFTSGTGDVSLSFRRQADAGGAEETLYTVSLHQPDSDNQRTVDFGGVLEPGYVYSLAANAGALRQTSSLPVPPQIFGQTTSTVMFTLTAVPEPATAGVLALSAALLPRRRRG